MLEKVRVLRNLKRKRKSNSILFFHIPFAILLSLTFFSISFADNVAKFQNDSGDVEEISLGDEFVDYEKSGEGGARKGSHSWEVATLLYLPNRVLDLIDIFRVDVGIGPTYGGVIRVSKYFQSGRRSVAPFSLRTGLRGRKFPVFLEQQSEFGFGQQYLNSVDRDITPAEVGVGLDMFIVGGYAGISFDEFVDFCVGIFGFDYKDDDF